MIAHETALWLSKSVGLFYLIAMSIAVLVYVFWPANKDRFDEAARSILDKDHQA
jgi:cytochrome c oxidase cbb3-type subunit 4